MSRLLIDEHPLQVLPTLATKIGLNEAVILQQIHYWNDINKKANNNFEDGYYWTFNSYEEWSKQFPFWSSRTIQRTIKRLEDMKLVVVGNYNKLQIDRTKWYRVDYKVLEVLETSPFGQNGTINMTKWLNHLDKMAPPLPETNTKTNTKINKNDNGVLPNGKNSANAFPNSEIVSAMSKYMNNLYFQKTGEKHPYLKPEQYKRVYDTLDYFCNENAVNEDGLIAMMVAFLNSDIDSDWNINHFATEGILMNRFYEELY